MYGAISLYSQQLDELSGYFVQLRDKEIAIMSETIGSATHTLNFCLKNKRWKKRCQLLLAHKSMAMN